MRRVLITGGAGFVGYHLAAFLLKRGGIHVTLVDSLSRGRRDHDLDELLRSDGVKFIQGDLTERATITGLGGPYDALYHLAAVVGVKRCVEDPAGVLRTNLLSTINVADFVAGGGAKRLFYSSTSEVYAGALDHGLLPVPTPESVPIVISSPESPRFSYAVSKLAGEQYVRFRAQKKAFSFAISRYHNVYGPRMGYSHVIPEVIKRVLEKENPFKLIGGNQTRAFCHVSDAVRATVAVTESGVSGELFHIGTDRETPIRELVDRVFSEFSYRPKLVDVPAPEGSVARRCPDISKLKRVVKFTPEISLERGLPEVCRWYANALAQEAAWE